MTIHTLRIVLEAHGIVSIYEWSTSGPGILYGIDLQTGTAIYFDTHDDFADMKLEIEQRRKLFAEKVASHELRKCLEAQGLQLIQERNGVFSGFDPLTGEWMQFAARDGIEANLEILDRTRKLYARGEKP